MLSEVQYGTTRLDFSIKRSNRKTLAIEVHPDLSINVVSPYDISEEEIKQRVVKRANWIIKQQSFFEQFLPRTPEREYVSGETHFYLGRKYILKIRKSDEKSVKLMGGELRVKSLYKGDKEDVKRQLANWYFNHAQARFKQVLKESLTKFRKYNIEKPPLTIRRMKNRWGSCNPKGRIILNPEITLSGNVVIPI
jgi:predicted metal-dependent hydrolase